MYNQKYMGMVTSLRRKFGRRVWSGRMLLVVGGVCAIGVALLLQARAGTAGISLEPEQGAASQPAAVVSDSTASGGSAVKFSDGSTPTRDRVLLGTMVTWSRLQNETTYRNTFLNDFDSMTAGWEMKMGLLQPKQGQFDFRTADAMVAFADANHKQVRGHTLVWHMQLPSWLTSRSWTSSQLDSIMKTHIQTVLTHFKGKIPLWDVVNESFMDDGSRRQNMWEKTIGPTYIEKAFEYAREADPNVKIFYNDFGMEWTNRKSTAVYNMVKDFKARGVPIDGVGFQAHLKTEPGDWSPSEQDIQTNIERFAALGVDVEFTELDTETSWTPGTTAQKLQAEADMYHNVAAACQAVPRCKRITTWGINDGSSWLGASQMALMFYDNYQPKPAYFAVRDVIGQ